MARSKADPPSEQPLQPLPEWAVGTVTVAVAPDCPFDLIRSAGRNWGRQAIQINVNDPDLPELRANPWLTVTEAV
jgi:hypothetical protein